VRERALTAVMAIAPRLARSRAAPSRLCHLPRADFPAGNDTLYGLAAAPDGAV